MDVDNVCCGTMKKRSSSSRNNKAMVICYVMLVICTIFIVIFMHLGSSISIWSSPSLVTYQDQNHLNVESKINCDRSHYQYDICSISGPTVLDPLTSTFYSIGHIKPTNVVEKIRPYPRKWENFTMSKIKEVTIISGQKGPLCNVVHNTTAIVFSAGGYTGNFFHEINEGFLPLFITVRSMSLINHDVTLVIDKSRDWWVSKYSDLLSAFSKYPIIQLDNETNIHCFKSAILGLISHGFMTINPKLMPKPTTLVDFHNFLSVAYGKVHHPTPHTSGQPKLVLISRPDGIGRVILEEGKTKTMAEAMGFEVIIFEPKPNTPLSKIFRLLNECHVLVGVHGAALTHLLFLRSGSIFIQIVPIGTDSIAEMCYGKPAKEMGLQYLEYKIAIEESSLVNKYNKIDPIIQDPVSLQKKYGWAFLKRIYLKEQDINLDLVKFKKYLKYALKKAKKFMYKVGT